MDNTAEVDLPTGLDLNDSGGRVRSVALAGVGPMGGGRLLGPRHNASHLLIWINRGGGRIMFDGTQHGFGPNSAIFVPANTVYQLDLSIGAAGWQVSVPEDLPAPLPLAPVLAGVSKPLAQNLLTKAFVGIQDEFIGNHPFRGAAMAYSVGMLAVLFARMDQEAARQDVSKDSARRRLMRRFIARLNERYNTADTVKDYARELGVTTTHLTRVCRQTAGKPTTQLIQERTLEAARQMLTRSTSRIGDISTQLGFSSPAYFTRLFSEKTGQSPKAYRRKHRGQPRPN